MVKMAKVQTAPLVSRITGGFQGAIFQNRRGTQVVQRKSTAPRRRTAGQITAANRFTNGSNIFRSLPQFAMEAWETIPKKPRETTRNILIQRFTRDVLPMADLMFFQFVQSRYRIDFRMVLHATYNNGRRLVGSIPPINPDGFEFERFIFMALPYFDVDEVGDVGDLSEYLVEETHFNHVWVDYPPITALIGVAGSFRSLEDGNLYYTGWLQGTSVPGEAFTPRYLL